MEGCTTRRRPHPRKVVGALRRRKVKRDRRAGGLVEPRPEDCRGESPQSPFGDSLHSPPPAPPIGSSPRISDIRDSANQPYFPSSLANNGSGEFILPLDLSYEVDLWGRVRRSVAAAKQRAQASAADLQTARLSLHAEVAIDYFEIRSADAQERLLNDTVKAYTEALRLTQNRFEGGASPKSDVAQAETQLKAARVLASDITVQRSQYEHALAILN